MHADPRTGLLAALLATLRPPVFPFMQKNLGSQARFVLSSLDPELLEIRDCPFIFLFPCVWHVVSEGVIE